MFALVKMFSKQPNFIKYNRTFCFIMIQKSFSTEVRLAGLEEKNYFLVAHKYLSFDFKIL
jgi:hypothetical protein